MWDANEVADGVAQEDAVDVRDAEEEREEREECVLSRKHLLFIGLEALVLEAAVPVTAPLRSDPWSRSGRALRMELRTPMAHCGL